MGKSLKGKELGKGISQRKDGLYQARFTNRFGKREVLYSKTYNDIEQAMRKAQYADEQETNVVNKNMTLDEFYEVWMNTCKCNCRDSTKEAYAIHYKRIQKELGWRKLTSLNLIIIQKAINDLCSDTARKNSKRILCDILEKAVDANLIIKNPAKQVNTVVTKEEKKERKVLTIKETEMFLNQAQGTYYYNMFVLALETGLRVGELCGLQWSDIDFEKKMISVKHTMCYFSKHGKYVFELHDTKTKNGKRIVPLTENAIKALKRQKIQKQMVIFNGKIAEEQYKDLVFVTKNNKPTQQFLIQESMNMVFNHLNKEYGEFDYFSPHTFRHTFATRAIENGMQPKTLSRLLGHATLQMTMDLYCHVTEDTLFAEMQKMEQAV